MILIKAHLMMCRLPGELPVFSITGGVACYKASYQLTVSTVYLLATGSLVIMLVHTTWLLLVTISAFCAHVLLMG